jgi:uncharacterized integral membrane protein (TIGR00698 family)
MQTLTVEAVARAQIKHPKVMPGALVALCGGAIGMAAGRLDASISPLLVAMVLGVLAANVVTLPTSLTPGLGWAGRRFLRVGVVLLGLQLSLREVFGLGPGVLVLVVVVVVSGIAVGRWLGARLGLSPTQSLLIACGFSICGAAAVAAVEGSIDAEDKEVATAVALVVAFGTAMIGLLPLTASAIGLSHHAAGIWAGASIHEVAQVVAAGGVIGGGAVAAAVVVKLARVLLLAPVLGWVGAEHRAQAADRKTVLIPLFVVGFCGLALVHTAIPIPHALLSGVGQMQTFLLATAMCALGCGVRIRDLRRTGPRPLILATALIVWVSAVGLVGAVLVG